MRSLVLILLFAVPALADSAASLSDQKLEILDQQDHQMSVAREQYRRLFERFPTSKFVADAYLALG